MSLVSWRCAKCGIVKQVQSGVSPVMHLETNHFTLDGQKACDADDWIKIGKGISSAESP